MKIKNKIILLLCICLAAVLFIGLQIVSGQNTLHSPYADNVSDCAQVRWINHRGHGSAPENTLSAFRMSKRKGYRYVECDVRFTSDIVPVLIHDQSVTRTSDNSGLVGEYTYEQLRSFDFGRRKAARYKGERIPSFDSFLELCVRLGLHPYIDLKELDGQKAAILYEIAAKHGMVYRVSWIGPHETLKLIKNLIPGARLGIIVKQSDPCELSRMVEMLRTASNNVFLDVQSRSIDVRLADWCRERGIQLEAWGVKDMSEAQRLISMGVTGITGDIIPKGEL